MEASRTAIAGVRIDHPAPSKASTAILTGASFRCVVPNHFVRQALKGAHIQIEVAKCPEARENEGSLIVPSPETVTGSAEGTGLGITYRRREEQCAVP